MLKEAYEYGLRLAAAEKGYPTFEDFKKEAAGLGLRSIGSQALRLGARGALGGAAVGAAGNAAFGDSSQGVMERAGKGALAGAAIGGGLGAGVGAAGQGMYLRAAGLQAAGARGSKAGLAGVKAQYAGRPDFYSGGAQRAGNWLNKNLNTASTKLFG